jgi:hypothetical protein
MKCFYHNDTSAVGTCKNCGRGLCSACLAATEDSLACLGRCEAKVERMNRMAAQVCRFYDRENLGFIAGAFFLVIGILSTIAIYREQVITTPMNYLPAVFFFCAGVASLVVVVNKRKRRKTTQKVPKTLR